MATTGKRPRCKYWEKCFRKDPTHTAKFLHPDDITDVEDEPKTKKTKVADPSVTTDGDVEMKPADAATSSADSKTDSKPAATKPRMKRGKTHEMSESEDDEAAPSPAKKKMVTVGTNTDAADDDEASTSTAATKTAATGAGTKTRPKCKYWNKCYRKDPQHKKNFLHPGDPTDVVMVADDGKMLTRGKRREQIKPLNAMEEGDVVEVKGVGDTVYRMKRTGDSYYCTCLGWKNQTKGPDKRTCKHLRDHLGEEFEDARCGKFKPAASASSITRGKRHKSIKQLLLAHKWQEEKQNPTGWWMSEKLDGVRAFWDGAAFFSRLGNEFIPPAWFTQDFPSEMELDGELFGGRGKFQSTVSIVKTPGSEDWKKITYQIFDVPSLGHFPFEKRIATVREYFEKNPAKYVVVLVQEKCKGVEHLKKELDRVEGLGGEGLMIREPGSKYAHARSHTLLKIKTFHDAEAKVIGHEPGKGNNYGRTGALRCVMECGKEFSVGSGMTDKDRRHPPKIGSIITYKFQELTNSGVPRFPSYLGIRIDMAEPKDAVLRPKPTD